MDRMSNGAMTGIIAGALVVAALAVFLPYVGSHATTPGFVPQESEGMGGQNPSTAEFAEMTNAITRAFQRTDGHGHILPCANRTLNEVKSMTNALLRIAVARHIAGEILALNLTNGNYRVRDLKIEGTIRSVPYVGQTLLYANAPELERCKFLFDSLQHFKEGALATLDELAEKMVQGKLQDGEPARNPNGTLMRFHGNGDRATCAKGTRLSLQHQPSYLNNGVFRLMYPKLSPGAQGYFKRRFREVFGIDYLPDKPGARAYLFGEDGTRWEGSGLKWRICDDNDNWRDAVMEE